MNLKIKEPVNALTHLAGAVLSAVALVWMIWKGAMHQSGIQIASAITFGVSLILLYSASTIYHWFPGSDKVTAYLRKVDHSMIYILIAGTYTPVCLLALKGTMGYLILAGIWTLALVGIIIKLLWFSAPRWISTAFYLILGWMAILFIVPLYKALPSGGFAWLVAGGLSYTIGSIIYATKSKRIKLSVFGFHEIFHLFVLGGSLSHYLMIERFILI